MLDLWKPILKLKDANNPVIFNELGYKYFEWDFISKKVVLSDIHPFVIFFYDEHENCYYYLKTRDAFYFDEKNNIYKSKQKSKYEIIIKSSKYDGLLTNDLYIDCSQIFKCDKKLLESLIDLECETYKKTDIISNYDKINILDYINNAIMEILPNLSIVEVKLNDNNQTYAKSIYLSEQKYNMILEEMLNSRNNNFDGTELREFNSSPNSDFKQNRSRYENGINFCKIFLKKYFPDDLNKFYKFHGLNSINKSITIKHKNINNIN